MQAERESVPSFVKCFSCGKLSGKAPSSWFQLEVLQTKHSQLERIFLGNIVTARSVGFLWGTSTFPGPNFTGESGIQLITQPERVQLLDSGLDRESLSL